MQQRSTLVCAALASVLLIAAGAPAATWYVAPEGKADNDGSQAKPWDIVSALANQQKANGKPRVQAGDEIVLLPGVYKRRATPEELKAALEKHAESPNKELFDIALIGDAGKPIVVRGPSSQLGAQPHPTIDGGFHFKAPAAHVWLRDVEVLVSEPRPASIDPGSHPDNIQRPWGGVTMAGGKNCKVINCAIHDCNQGMSVWAVEIDAEIYGCVIYDNGWQSTDRGHGHGIYTQNEAAKGAKTISDCVFTGGYGWSMHAYGSKNAFVERYTLTRNIAAWCGTFLVGGGKPNKDDHLLGNYLYSAAMQVGYGADNEDVEIRDNTIVNGQLSVRKGTAVVNENNLVIGPNDARPDKTIVALLPNKYDPERANLAVYRLRAAVKPGPKANRWVASAATQPSPPVITEPVEWIEIDAGAFLKDGQQYDLFEPRGLYGKPAHSGACANGKLRVPIRGEFEVYIVRRVAPRP